MTLRADRSRPLRIAAITSGENVPSSRFRVRQYAPLFHDAGHRLDEYVPAIDKYAAPSMPVAEGGASRQLQRVVWGGLRAVKLLARVPAVVGSRRADVTWLEREMIPAAFTLERAIRKPFVFDVDDAIWMGGPGAADAARRIAERAAVVMAGNGYIAEWFSRFNSDVRVVPTAIDTARFHPAAIRRPASRFRLAWTGVAYNLPYLYAIEEALDEFLKTRDAELLVISDAPPRFRRISPASVVFVPWTPGVEAEALRTADVGLMPLPDDDWTRGKCSLKMIQYMATGIPSIVSPVGMNAEILEASAVGVGARDGREWREALSKLYEDGDLRLRLGKGARTLAVERFSRDIVFRTILDVFETVSR
jgi:glycosyltransferase involved in cell wall biosynthesis